MIIDKIIEHLETAEKNLEAIENKMAILGGMLNERDSRIVELNRQVSELEQQHRWIPVSERLPEIREDIILISTCNGNFFTVVFDGDYILQTGSLLTRDEVTHWMNITPPKGE
jgi:hypothetical protein